MLNENKENVNSEIKDEEFIECGIIEPRIDKKNNIIDNSNNVSIIKTNDTSFLKKSKDSNIDLMKSNDIQIKKIKTNYISNLNNKQNKKIFESLFSSNYSIKNNDLKLVLFNKDFLFREEFNDFNFNIETSILFKSPNNKKYKNYHLSIKNQVLLILSYKKERYEKLNKSKKTKNQKIINNNESNEDLKNIKTFSIINKLTNKSLIDKNQIKNSNNIQTFNNKILQYNEIYDIFHPILILNFNLISVSISTDINNYELTINILSLKKISFTLKLPSKNKQLLQKIYMTLQNSIITSYGYYINLFGVSINKNFFKYYYISYNEFEYKSKTGDILLFKGLSYPSKLQRCYTKNEYDHVAILHKKNGFLYFYDATSKDGCKERNFYEFLAYMWNLLYEKIVYRELIINENDINLKKNILKDLDKKIDIYMNKTKGKKYQMKLFPLLCGSSKKKYQEENKWNLKEGFICSSLIMGAYLQMGICDYLKNINGIFPGDFSQDGFLPMKKPFELGPEYIIDFSY